MSNLCQKKSISIHTNTATFVKLLDNFSIKVAVSWLRYMFFFDKLIIKVASRKKCVRLIIS